MFNPQPKGIKKGFKPNLDAVYKILKVRKLAETPNCEVCSRPANQVHHKALRRGLRLIIYEWFMSICQKCHDKYQVDSDAAFDAGVSIPHGRADVMKRVQWVKENLEEYILSLKL